MKIVKFTNGTYGVRREVADGFLGTRKRFEFLSNNGNWWAKRYSLEYKLEHTKEEAERLYRLVADEGELVADEGEQV